ncbi:DUF2975 domain-containing protein [Hyunsoonleella flava]|uniref:DUF2975 domain-containing protein n=1 Tax=Hyunsoonleella flava TaxID=2527939 RepID=A0A4Q9FG58_9FLAO|nr:DUF2975 domain-containing protein [Hyunsoonleella flava]TBN03922.1 DUF2975 domain-containing protein [Hyunsoonleella flava]
MKTIELLKKLITVYYYLLIIGFVAIIFLIVTGFSSGDISGLNIIEDYDVSQLGVMELIALAVVPFTIYILFVRTVYLLKATLRDLSEGNYFSKLVINHFSTIGKLILICAVLYATFKFVARLLLLSDVRLGIDFSLITPIAIGLFFMFLSEVFTKARKTEEENKLTI